MDALKQTQALIQQDFELVVDDQEQITEEQLLMALHQQVAYMLENRAEFLFSLLYRLDVSERKVDAALAPNGSEDPALVIAQLILDRQKQRIYTKNTYKPPVIDDPDFEW